MIKFRENIWIGDYKSVFDEDSLVRAGISAILNVSATINDPSCSPTAYRQVKVSLSDDSKNKDFMKEIAILSLMTMVSNGEKVLVHCSAGLSRSVFVAVMAVSISEDKDWHDILAELQKAAPTIMPGPLFEGTPSKLSEYFAKLEKENDLEKEGGKDDAEPSMQP